MLVNNINIKSFNAKLLKKNIQTAEIVIYGDWLRGSLTPTYLGKEEKYKQIEIKLLIEELDDESALNRISYLIKELTKCTLKFKDLSYYYDCTIESKEHGRITKGVYELDVELKSGYAYKPEKVETMSNITSKVIGVAGNQKTPAIVEITPATNLIALTIIGLGDPITVKSLTKGKKIIIDGEKGTVTEEGQNKYKDYGSWGFPYLLPGKNTVSIDNDNVDMKIKYKSRWI